MDLCKNSGSQSLCEVGYFALGYIGRWTLEVTFLLILAAASTDGVIFYWVQMKHMKGKGNVLVDIGLGLLCAVLFCLKISSGCFRAQTWSYISNSKTAVGHQGRPWPALDTLG